MIFKKYPLLIAMMALTVILFFSAWNTGSLYILFSACIWAAFVIVGCGYPAWSLGKVDLTIEKFPAALNDKTPVTITIHTMNSGWLARRELFLVLKVVSRFQGSAHSRRTSLPVIKQGSSLTDLDFGNMRRGRYQLSQETLFFTGFPFGFIERKKPVITRQDSMVVYPYRFPVNRAIFNLGETRNYSAIQTRQSAGNSSEFFGIREYRYGDSIRHIDWKTTAKHNEIIVREFEEITTQSFIIAINSSPDFSPPDDIHELFEKSIRVAASISTELLRSQYPVGLYTHHVQLDSAADTEQEERIMNFLTDAENTGDKNYWSGLFDYASSLAAHKTLLLFENGGAGKLNDIEMKINALSSLGHEVKLVLFVDQDHHMPVYDIQTWRIPVASDVEGSLFE